MSETQRPDQCGDKNSGTPRTDAIGIKDFNPRDEANVMRAMREWADLCRQLERELALRNSEIELLIESKDWGIAEIGRLKHDLERAMANHNADLNAPRSAAAPLDRDHLWQRHRIIDRLGNGYIGRDQFEGLLDELRIAPSATQAIKPWWVPPIRYDKDRGYFFDAAGTLIAVARAAIADHMQEQIAAAINAAAAPRGERG